MELRGTPTKNSTYVPTGKIWPSGDFSVGYRKVAGDDRVEFDTMEQWYQTGALDCPPDKEVGRYGVPVPAPDGAEPLNLTNVLNSHKPPKAKKQRGLGGITSYGRKMVKSACTLLDELPSRRLTFCTVTMPSLPPEQRRELAECWPEYLRQALQYLSRQLSRSGLAPLIASASEIQPGRLEADKEAYLHLHLCWPNVWAKAGNWAVDVKEFRSWSEKFLRNRGLLPDGGWVNVNVQQVKKSCAAYLGKYMSKGSDIIAQAVEDLGESAIPRQWWNLTKPMRDMVLSGLRTGDDVGQMILNIVDYAFDCNDFDAFWALRHCEMEYDGRLINTGWRGVFKRDLLRELQAMFSD